MIAVFVREKNAIELFWRDTTMFQAQHQLSRAQPTIDKNFAMISRDERAVSRAPAAEHRQAEHGSDGSPISFSCANGNNDEAQMTSNEGMSKARCDST